MTAIDTFPSQVLRIRARRWNNILQEAREEARRATLLFFSSLNVRLPPRVCVHLGLILGPSARLVFPLRPAMSIVSPLASINDPHGDTRGGAARHPPHLLVPECPSSAPFRVLQRAFASSNVCRVPFCAHQ